MMFLPLSLQIRCDTRIVAAAVLAFFLFAGSSLAYLPSLNQWIGFQLNPSAKLHQSNCQTHIKSLGSVENMISVSGLLHKMSNSQTYAEPCNCYLVPLRLGINSRLLEFEHKTCIPLISIIICIICIQYCWILLVISCYIHIIAAYTVA